MVWRTAPVDNDEALIRHAPGQTQRSLEVVGATRLSRREGSYASIRSARGDAKIPGAITARGRDERSAADRLTRSNWHHGQWSLISNHRKSEIVRPKSRKFADRFGHTGRRRPPLVPVAVALDGGSPPRRFIG
jgi:hypothetical protein